MHSTNMLQTGHPLVRIGLSIPVYQCCADDLALAAVWLHNAAVVHDDADAAAFLAQAAAHYADYQQVDRLLGHHQQTDRVPRRGWTSRDCPLT
jgi:hypothetical protein